MATGFPVKADYASGDVLTAAQMNDLSSTLNYLDPTAKGDLFPASSGTALTRLAVGANDTVLTADSSTATGLKWASSGGGGSMTLISTTTLSGSSITLSSIPQTYNHLQLIIKNSLPVSDGGLVNLRINGDSGTRYATDLTGSNVGVAFDNDKIQIIRQTDDTVNEQLGVYNFYDYTNTTTWKMGEVNSITAWQTTPTNVSHIFTNFAYNQEAAITSLEIFSGVANMSSGTALLYGVK